MEIYLKRKTAGAEGTRGFMYLPSRDGIPTIEPRPNQGKGAIPAGRYRVVVTWSPRFKKELPVLVRVPGFEGIRIHGGSRPEHSAGCILVAKGEVDGITKMIKACYERNEDVHISIIDGIGVCGREL